MKSGVLKPGIHQVKIEAARSMEETSPEEMNVKDHVEHVSKKTTRGIWLSSLYIPFAA